MKTRGLNHQSNEVMLLYLALQIDRNFFFETQIWGEVTPDLFRAVYLDPKLSVKSAQLEKWESRKIDTYYLHGSGTTSLEKLR